MVDDIQDQIERTRYTDDLLEQEKNAQLTLENVLNLEEIFWKEKSKVKWHSEGDRNTPYFHRVAKIKQASSLITTLGSGDVLLDDPEDVSEHIVSHFTSLFTQNSNIINDGMV